MKNILYKLIQVTKFIIVVLSIIRFIMEFIYKMTTKKRNIMLFVEKKYK